MLDNVGKSEKVIQVLRDLKSATAAEIAVLASCSPSAVRDVLQEAMETDSRIKSIRGKGYVYSEDDTKNSEGYTDMTPYLAMMNAPVSDSVYTDGAIYARAADWEGYQADPEWYLIVRGFKTHTEALQVYETSHNYYDAEHCIAFYIEEFDREYFVDPRRLMIVTPKKIGKCQAYIMPEEFARIKEAIIHELYLDVTSVPKEAMTQSEAIAVLKESGWLKSHDDAVASAVAPTVQATDENIELIKRERDIWKEAFFASCGRFAS